MPTLTGTIYTHGLPKETRSEPVPIDVRLYVGSDGRKHRLCPPHARKQRADGKELTVEGWIDEKCEECEKKWFGLEQLGLFQAEMRTNGRNGKTRRR